MLLVADITSFLYIDQSVTKLVYIQPYDRPAMLLNLPDLSAFYIFNQGPCKLLLISRSVFPKQETLHVEDPQDNHQQASVVFHKGQLMVTRTRTGEEDHVRILTSNLTHGGELIWDLFTKYLRSH